MKLGPSCGGAVLQRPRGPSWSAFAATAAVAMCPVTAAASAASSARDAGMVKARAAAARAREILLFIVFPPGREAKLVIPGWCESTRPQMRNCASGNLEILRCALAHRSSMLRIAPERRSLRVAAVFAEQIELLLYRTVGEAEQHRILVGFVGHPLPARHHEQVARAPFEGLLADPGAPLAFDRREHGG